MTAFATYKAVFPFLFRKKLQATLFAREDYLELNYFNIFKKVFHLNSLKKVIYGTKFATKVQKVIIKRFNLKIFFNFAAILLIQYMI
jgi:hypothetical protein